MTIKIPVSAEFEGGNIRNQIATINAQMKALGTAAAQANKQKFEPVTLRSKEDLKSFVKEMEKLLKIQGELRNRMKQTGQSGKTPLSADWSLLYSDPKVRYQKMQQALGFLGADFDELPAPNRPRGHSPIPPANRPSPPPGGGRGNRSGGGGMSNPWAQMGANVVQSGLRAAGPAGGVAANAVGTGMSSGFGAGLMGLMGGMLALGVGKLVGMATEKLDQAEQNNINYDRLKRTVGDVSVSFDGLKTIIQENANNLGITFDEAGKLSTQFAKLSNLSADQYKQIGSELSTGVGFSRGFGLDPSQGVGVFGQMRGMRITNNDQDSRRVALLIGETIAKSDAFAKADEVMEAIAGFATSQTRNQLSTPNLMGYAGQYSALVGSGIPGLDPSGAGALLSRVNASLSAGGARGEASQFFSSMVANRMGLDPIQAAIMREGGAFATNDLMFGGGSAAARYGVQGPMGDSTFLQETLGTLRDKYKDPGMRAMATANHLGIGINQAMALLSVNPNQMGDLQRGLVGSGVDISNLNSSGIANLSKVYSGSASDRQALADSLYGRTGSQALTGSEADRLRTAMASGDEDAQKKILTELIASRDQERTTGSDIRDSKNILDNIKTAIADKLIPLTLETRHGVMAIAGVGKGGVTPQSIQERVIRAEFEGKSEAIRQQYQTKIDEQKDRSNAARRDTVGIPTEEEANLPRDQQLRAMTERQNKAKAEMDAAEAEINRLTAERDGKLRDIGKEADAAVDTAYGKNGSNPPSDWRAGVTPISRISDVKDPEQQRRLAAFLEATSASEGANYDTIVGGGKFSDFSDHPNKVGLITGDGPSTAAGRYQITGRTWRDLKKKLGLTDFGPESQDRAAIELLRRRGALDDVLNGNVDAALSKLGDEWQGLPSGTSAHQGKRSRAFFDREYNKGLERNTPAQLPAGDGAPTQVGTKIEVPPIEVIHKNEQGQQVQPTQTIQPVVTPSRPFGMGG